MSLAQIATIVVDICLGAAALHLAQKVQASLSMLAPQVADHERRITHLEIQK